MPKNTDINLLPQQKFETSTVGRILKWATGTFRIIVIITEIVVMGAFLSRFWLDAQNSTLTDSIKVKSAQITAQSDLEKQFRAVQSQLNIFSQLSETHNSSQRIEDITSKLAPDITLSGLSISETSAQIKGTSLSDMGIAQFTANLQADKSFKDVEIGQVNSSQNNPVATDFSISITY